MCSIVKTVKTQLAIFFKTMLNSIIIYNYTFNEWRILNLSKVVSDKDILTVCDQNARMMNEGSLWKTRHG